MLPGPLPEIGRFLLTLDGQSVVLHDMDGGNVRGSVITLPMAGAQQAPRKQISTLQYEPFTFAVDLAMGKPLAEWIKATLNLSSMRKSGSVAVATMDGKVQSQRQFRNALIEEITVPATDASSKALAFLTIKIRPEEIAYGKGDNAPIQTVAPVPQKQWLCSNFRLRIGQLPCSRVSKIDAFTIKHNVSTDAVGSVRPGKETASIEFPNLKITFSAADLAPWQEWFIDFVMKGNCGQDKELQGTLEFLAPNASDLLGSIELSQVGIYALYPQKSAARVDAIARFTAELYVEKMVIKTSDV